MATCDISVFSLGISLLAALIAFLCWRAAVKALTYQTTADSLRDFRSPQMCLAILKLWEFYWECNCEKDKLVKEYISRLQEDRKKGLTNEEWQSTLHYQRRLVSLFFQQLAYLHLEKEIVKEDFLKSCWSKDHFELIGEIICPIEKALAKTLNISIGKPTKNMNELYEKAIKWYQQH